MLRKQKTKLDMLVIENIREIKDFINTSVPSVKKQSASNDYKIRVECPYCNEHKKNLNLALNLDWGSFKCFRCGTTGSLITYLKAKSKYRNIPNDNIPSNINLTNPLLKNSSNGFFNFFQVFFKSLTSFIPHILL